MTILGVGYGQNLLDELEVVKKRDKKLVKDSVKLRVATSSAIRGLGTATEKEITKERRELKSVSAILAKQRAAAGGDLAREEQTFAAVTEGETRGTTLPNMF